MAVTKKILSQYDVKLVTEWHPPVQDAFGEVDMRPLIVMPNIPKPLHACLRGDAEVLTADGWKRIDSVTTNDTVATWDKDKEEIKWDKPIDTIRTFSKQMVRVAYKTYGTFGFLATPEHRLPIWKRDYPRPQKNGKRATTGEPVFKIIESTAAGVGMNVNNFFITAAKNGSEEKESQLTDMERLYVSIQADGSLRSETGGIKTYRMSFKKDRKKKRFEELCQNAKADFTKIKHAENSICRERHYQQYSIRVSKDCKNFWNCFDIKTFSQEKAIQFINEISVWDGSCAETCGILNRRYVSTSLDNIKFAQAVAMIAGVTSSFQTRKRDGRRGWKDCYVLDFLDKSVRGAYDCKKTIEDFYDYAYCLTVPSSFFVARDADTGSTMITGNCAPRTLLGASTWNHMRSACYAAADNTCEICGDKPENLRHRHAHEVYEIDYEKGTAKFVRAFCVCALDHLGCIHTGRAITLFKQGNPLYPKEFLLEGAEKAFKIVQEYNKDHPEADLRCYTTYLDYLKCDDLREEMEGLIEKYKVKFYQEDEKKMAKWGDWKLIIGEREYPTPYKSFKEWEEAMKKANENDTARMLQRGAEEKFSGGIYDELDKILDSKT